MPTRKRKASDLTDAPPSSLRRSGRTSAMKKSHYFEEQDSESPDIRPSKHEKTSHGRKKKWPDDQYDEDDGEKERQEEAPEEDEDEDGPRKVTILPLEKLRDTGGVDYEDDRIHKNTMLFLKDLKANNQRQWLKSHDGEYRRALKDWESFVQELTLCVIEVDDTIPDLPTKDVIFRIHRDIRFSKDPTPYKPYFSAAFSRTGRKGPYACYYIHCEPGACSIGGGLWQPDREGLARLRRSIDRHPERWRAALNTSVFRSTFFPGIRRDGSDESVVKAFLDYNKNSALKTRPQGYPLEHPDIKLLCLRSFIVGMKLEDSLFYRDDAQQQISGLISGLEPLVTFLNSIARPDPGQAESSDDE